MAYFALIKLHILPSQLFALSENEQAFIYAAAEIYSKEQKKLRDEANKLK
jgi:hypothetical protein